MKMLLPPAQIVIPSNRPRTRAGPDSRGIRICFAELGRSCALMQGYLIFTDGSAYVYDAPSNDDVENLCAQIQRGRVFNLGARRAAFGFVRGFTPPPDYETIYSYPPYPGMTPASCGLPVTDWGSLVWNGSQPIPPFGGSVSGTGLNFVGAFPGGSFSALAYSSTSLDVKTDASTLDVTVHNSDVHGPIAFTFTQNILGGATLTFAGIASGATQTQTLTLIHGVSTFQGDSAIGGSVSQAWDVTLVPHP